MANMLAGGMVALGVEMETEGRDSAKMRKSYDAVKELRPRTELQPKYHPRLIGEGPRVLDDAKVDILDFPIRFASRTLKESKHLIDIIREHEGDFDIEAIKTLMDTNNCAALPAPLFPQQAAQLAYTLDLQIEELSSEPGSPKKWMVFKWSQFIDKTTTAELIDNICQGESFFPIWAHADPF